MSEANPKSSKVNPVSPANPAAAVLNCSQDYEPTIFSKIESLKAKVVVVRNPFEANWIDKLASISASSEKFFILTHPFIEDLIILNACDGHSSDSLT